MKRAEPSTELPALSVVRNVVFGRVFSQLAGQSKSTLTGATARRG